jgi:cysteinyl-tRNA synthetase
MVAVLGIDPGDFAVTDAVSTGVDAALEVLVAGLLQARAQARAGRDFAAADAARDQLSAAGIVLSDGADGTTWSLATESKGPTSG